MRYTHLFDTPPSPSDAGLIIGIPGKIKGGPLSLQKPRLPKSRHHHTRKESLSSGGVSLSSVDKAPSEGSTLDTKSIREAIGEIDADIENKATTHKLELPRLKPWESYLHWLTLTEEPGTLWTSSLCTALRECLSVGATQPSKAPICAVEIDDIYWSYYLPLDPLLSRMEDRILSGYLLHVWTIFIELGKRIPHDDEGQDRLVELLKELVHLPPMEVRTWEGNDAPWSDLPTLDDALVGAWDDLYDPENQAPDAEGSWVNYFSFLGRLVAADVTPDWWEIPATTLKEALAEQGSPTHLTRYKTMAVAEFMNRAGDAFFDWCIVSGVLSDDKNLGPISSLADSPISRMEWLDRRSQMKESGSPIARVPQEKLSDSLVCMGDV